MMPLDGAMQINVQKIDCVNIGKCERDNYEK